MRKFDMHAGIFLLAVVMLVLSTLVTLFFIFIYGFVAPFSILAIMTRLGYVFAVYILLTEY